MIPDLFNQRISVITHNDMDGIFCGLIVKQKYPQTVIYTTNYGRPISPDWTNGYDVVFVTDFNFDGLSTMKAMEDCSSYKLVWIDHHAIIDEAKAAGFNPEGLRRTDVSAAHLVWEYLNPDIPVPRVIKLISDYDIWKWEDNIDAMYFQNTIRNYNIEPMRKEAMKLFNGLLQDDNLLNQMIDSGKIIQAFNEYTNQKLCEEGVFKTSIDGHLALACNTKSANSSLFDSLTNIYPDIKLRILFAYFSSIDGYRVSVFSLDDSISANDICAKFKGGGHRGAAGFRAEINRLPFQVPAPIGNFPVKPCSEWFMSWKQEMVSNPILEVNALSSGTVMIYSHEVKANINGYSACAINNPTGLVQSFYQTHKQLNYQLGVFWYVTKTGWYKYRIYPLDPRITKVELMNKFPGAMPIDAGIIWYTNRSPLEGESA